MIFNIFVFTVFAVLWLAFAAALIFNPRLLDSIWQSLRSLPLIVQGLVWLLFLPVVLGLWIWESSWPLWLRLLLIVSIAAWTFLVMYPRRA